MGTGTQIVVSPINTEDVRREVEDVRVLLKNSVEIVVHTQEENEGASKVLKQVKDRHRELEAKRKSITSPLDQAKREVQELFKKPLGMLLEAEKSIKSAMLSFVREQEEKTRKRQRQLQEEAEKRAEEERKRLEKRILNAEAKGKEEKAEVLQRQKEKIRAVAPILAQPKVEVEGISYREQWRAEVINIDILPREYMVANQQMLDGIAQTTKGGLEIPGVKFVSHKIVVSR